MVWTEGIHPTWLVAVRKAAEGPTLGHLIEDGDVFGDTQRIVTGEDQAALNDPEPLGLHIDEKIEHDRVGGAFLALDVEVMLGEGNEAVEKGR
jgi:hypothetical protein